MTKLSFLTLSILITLTLQSCTLAPELRKSALDYNKTSDEVQKQILLLNVARAFRGEGLAYTGISEMRGNFTLTGEVSSTLQFGGDAVSSFTGTPKVSIKTNPQIVIKPLTTSEFQTAISLPISPQIFHQFWEQGWPKELLLHLLIEKIVLRIKTERNLGSFESSKQVDLCPLSHSLLSSAGSTEGKFEPAPEKSWFQCVYDNDPTNEEGFFLFQRMLEAAKFEPYLKRITGEPVGPSVPAEDIGILKSVAAIHDGNLVLVRDDEGKYFLKQTDSTSVLIKHDPSLLDHFNSRLKEIFPEIFALEFIAKPHESKSVENDVSIRIHLRSPEGLIYFLGELVRAQQDRHIVLYNEIYGPQVCAPPDLSSKDPRGPSKFVNSKISENEWRSPSSPPAEARVGCLHPIFLAWTGEGEAEVSIQHKNQRYFIPNDVIEIKTIGKDKKESIVTKYLSRQSLISMALVQRLFNINTSREEFPSVPTVVSTGG